MGLYDLLPTPIGRASGTVLTGFNSTSNIFNVDHLNHVTHTEPESINSAEEDLTAMQVTVDPAPLGVVSLPASMQDEVERLRFTLAQIKQRLIAAATPPQWYEPIEGLSDGLFLPPTALRRELTVPTNIPSGGSPTIVPFNSTIYNHGGYTASLSGTQLPVAGTYMVGATVGITAAEGVFRILIVRNSPVSTNIIGARTINTGTDASDKIITVETVASLTTSNVVNIFAYQSHGSQRALIVNSTIRPAMWVNLLGR